MGLFSAFKGIIHAVSPIAGAIMGAHDNRKAIGKANAATQLGITNATGALNDQLATTTENFSPYTTAGASAIGQQGDILGLNGAGAQSSILDQLHASPLFQSLFRTGHETALGDAAATGGLRGGNFQSSEMNFGADTFAKVIQQQMANLGGISGQGLQATGQLAGFGANNATQIAGLDTGSGSANAGAILGKQAVTNNMYSQIQKMIAQAVSGGAGGGIGASPSMSGLPF